MGNNTYNGARSTGMVKPSVGTFYEKTALLGKEFGKKLSSDLKIQNLLSKNVI